MMTAEQALEIVRKLPEHELQRFFARLNELTKVSDDEDKWNLARRKMAELSGALDLGEQLAPAPDRETLYEDREL